MPGISGRRAVRPRLSRHRCESASERDGNLDYHSAPGKTDLPGLVGLRVGREAAVLWSDLPKACVNLNHLSYWSPFTCKSFADKGDCLQQSPLLLLATKNDRSGRLRGVG